MSGMDHKDSQKARQKARATDNRAALSDLSGDPNPVIPSKPDLPEVGEGPFLDPRWWMEADPFDCIPEVKPEDSWDILEQFALEWGAKEGILPSNAAFQREALFSETFRLPDPWQDKKDLTAMLAIRGLGKPPLLLASTKVTGGMLDSPFVKANAVDIGKWKSWAMGEAQKMTQKSMDEKIYGAKAAYMAAVKKFRAKSGKNNIAKRLKENPRSVISENLKDLAPFLQVNSKYFKEAAEVLQKAKSWVKWSIVRVFFEKRILEKRFAFKPKDSKNWALLQVRQAMWGKDLNSAMEKVWQKFFPVFDSTNLEPSYKPSNYLFWENREYIQKGARVNWGYHRKCEKSYAFSYHYYPGNSHNSILHQADINSPNEEGFDEKVYLQVAPSVPIRYFVGDPQHDRDGEAILDHCKVVSQNQHSNEASLALIFKNILGSLSGANDAEVAENFFSLGKPGTKLSVLISSCGYHENLSSLRDSDLLQSAVFKKEKEGLLKFYNNFKGGMKKFLAARNLNKNVEALDKDIQTKSEGIWKKRWKLYKQYIFIAGLIRKETPLYIVPYPLEEFLKEFRKLLRGKIIVSILGKDNTTTALKEIETLRKNNQQLNRLVSQRRKLRTIQNQKLLEEYPRLFMAFSDFIAAGKRFVDKTKNLKGIKGKYYYSSYLKVDCVYHFKDKKSSKDKKLTLRLKYLHMYKFEGKADKKTTYKPDTLGKVALGVVGTNGMSTAPHLHIEAEWSSNDKDWTSVFPGWFFPSRPEKQNGCNK